MSDSARLAVTSGLFAGATTGWAVGGLMGTVAGLTVAILALVVPWRGQPLWRWTSHYLSRNRPIDLADPLTVANDRSAGGLRYQDGVAVAVVQLHGSAHSPTVLVGSAGVETANTVDVGSVVPLLQQSLGLQVESASFVTLGARRGGTGDYPRVYDTLIGPVAYAGVRETWLVVRIRGLDNGDALRCRTTIGTAALAAAQRIAAALRCQGVRARAATAADILELERRLGRSALEPHHRRWSTLRGDGGWVTTYAYRPADVTAEVLSAAWTLHADGIAQNLTVFPDRTCCATVTVRTSQPPTAAPSVVLQTLPGQQARALANTMCGPRRDIAGQARRDLPRHLVLPVGQSGVLLGKVGAGDRLLVPLTDPAEFSRIRISADDAITKRILARAAGAGERLTVHSKDIGRWDSVRMPNLVVTDQARPAPGTTISVTDGTVSPAPRPHAVIEVGPAEDPARTAADVVITQTGPATVDLHCGGVVHSVEIEFFRVENRYAAGRSEYRRMLADPA